MSVNAKYKLIKATQFLTSRCKEFQVRIENKGGYYYVTIIIIII